MARIPKEFEAERRTYVLPKGLLEQIRRYQSENNISSEVEAVRNLLGEALQYKDSLDDIMAKISGAELEESNLRLTAQNVLSGHVLVKYIIIDDYELKFGLKNGCAGGIDINGNMLTGTVDSSGSITLNEPWDISHALYLSKDKNQ